MRTAPIETYSDLELALMVLLGYFGNGERRKSALGNRYGSAQGIVDEILNTNTVPAGSGSAADPEKLDEAINKTFDDTLKELREEIIANYD